MNIRIASVGRRGIDHMFIPTGKFRAHVTLCGLTVRVPVRSAEWIFFAMGWWHRPERGSEARGQ